MEEKGKIDKAKQEYRQGEEKLDQERHRLSRLTMRAQYPAAKEDFGEDEVNEESEEDEESYDESDDEDSEE